VPEDDLPDQLLGRQIQRRSQFQDLNVLPLKCSVNPYAPLSSVLAKNMLSAAPLIPTG
jgi:hypothetical protein